MGCKEGDKPSQVITKKEEKPLINMEEDKYMSLQTIDFVMGHFEPSERKDFIAIPAKYADRNGMYMHKDAYNAFVEMEASASKEGIKLVIRSAARNFNYQKSIWEAKWSGSRKLSGGINASKTFPHSHDRATEIMKYSAMPGASRHHWGTDIDFNAFENVYFESGAGKKLFDWLEKNASIYGFGRPYTAKGTDRIAGYEEEKWHWSYLPIAKELTNFVASTLKDENLKGFSGAEEAKNLGVKENYILGISKKVL